MGLSPHSLSGVIKFMSDLEIQNSSDATKALRGLISESRDQIKKKEQNSVKNARTNHGEKLQKLGQNKESLKNGHLGSAEKEGNRVQVNAGRAILKVWQRFHSEDVKATREKKAGRPKKIDSEKMQKVKVSLSTDELEEIDRKSQKDKNGKSLRSRYIRQSLSRLRDFEKREYEQARVFKSLLHRVKDALDLYAKKIDENGNYFNRHDENCSEFQKLKKRISDLKLVYSIVQFDEKSIDIHFNKEEKNIWKFCLKIEI